MAAPPPRRRPRVFYGWVIVATMAVVSMAQTAEFNPVLGVFLKPITEEFGWSRAIFAGAITVGTIGGGLLALITGPLLDRVGPRWILSLAFLLLGGTVMGLAAIDALSHFYALMASSRAIVSGVISIATGVVISKWFIRRRGRAMALAATGTRVGNALMPLYVQLALSAFGWRFAALALGGLTWATTLLPTIIFLRRQPEDMGLRPDGDPPQRMATSPGEAGDPRSTDGGSEVSYTVRQALRTRPFYFILFTSAALFFSGAGINFNLFPHLTDKGISPNAAITVLTTWSLLSTFGGLAAGFVAERVAVRYMMVATFLLVAVGVWILSLIQNLTMAYLFAVVHGLTFGGIPLFQQLIWAEYFGRRHQGAIRGFVTPFQMGSNALGPLAATLVFDLTGSYIPIFRALIALYVVAAVAMLLAGPPVKRRAHNLIRTEASARGS